ncbi:hypothetical protein BD310DRAFT_916790 [Dichomitus squalens]|uniref:Uncharacterized protein n=1 Tax=Dichomitus squalens TaxID=114155 RepID=A0A4Q9QAD9_9APHY|nr:hypothetical protein BD310DRAFT_916790 [Dichomitus squalens]
MSAMYFGYMRRLTQSPHEAIEHSQSGLVCKRTDGVSARHRLDSAFGGIQRATGVDGGDVLVRGL